MDSEGFKSRRRKLDMSRTAGKRITTKLQNDAINKIMASNAGQQQLVDTYPLDKF